ncbi:MAG TPA: MBL fold metallo-hydrolase [Candidatus Sulfotelmatobacter sp.]|nr:MBL fold metallo-hydrolase [Candidatus Sulfotelmatobacter sp.]
MEYINWLGNSGFSFHDNMGNNIYFIDPLEINQKIKDKADLIFITHAHSDHFSPKDIDKILKTESVIVAPPDILEKIDKKNVKISVEPNKEYEAKGFKFWTFPAYNTHPNRLKFHPKVNNWVGYFFNINGKKIYHAGDTDFIPEMEVLAKWKIDIAMLPIGGTYTMDALEAAKAANAIGAKITIPMHYKMQAREKADQFLEEFKKMVINSKVLILEELN